MKLLRVGKVHHQGPVGQKSVFVAVAGNFAVAILKIIAWVFTGSGVMLAEGVHSLADTANQGLLFLGIKRSERPATDEFQYGYKQERFFWALVSACGIFFLGAGFTFYHGVKSLLHHEYSHVSPWVFAVLLASVFLEGYALLTAFWEAKHLAGEQPLKKFLKHSADPTVMAVIYEDSAALIGIFIAFLSIILTRLTGSYIWDAAGSILVSLLLAVVAILLMNANRKFILNKAVPAYTRHKIRETLEAEELVDEIHDFKTVMMGVDGIIVKAEIEINGHYLSEKIMETDNIRGHYKEIKDEADFVKYTSHICDKTTRILGREIDELEKRVIEKVPAIKHLDIETN